MNFSRYGYMTLIVVRIFSLTFGAELETCIFVKDTIIRSFDPNHSVIDHDRVDRTGKNGIKRAESIFMNELHHLMGFQIDYKQIKIRQRVGVE